MNSPIKTLIYGAIIFSAILVSGVGVDYALAGNPATEIEGVVVEDVKAVASGWRGKGRPYTETG